MKHTKLFATISFSLFGFCTMSQLCFATESGEAEILEEAAEAPVFEFNIGILIFCCAIFAVGILIYNIVKHLQYKQLESVDMNAMMNAILKGKKKYPSGGKGAYGSYGNNASYDAQEQMRQMQDWQFQQQMQMDMQHAMDEGIKSVTPFDMGGYVQGPGFNPSDTFANDQMNNNMNMGGMNDFGGMGMM